MSRSGRQKPPSDDGTLCPFCLSPSRPCCPGLNEEPRGRLLSRRERNFLRLGIERLTSTSKSSNGCKGATRPAKEKEVPKSDRSVDSSVLSLDGSPSGKIGRNQSVPVAPRRKSQLGARRAARSPKPQQGQASWSLSRKDGGSPKSEKQKLPREDHKTLVSQWHVCLNTLGRPSLGDRTKAQSKKVTLKGRMLRQLPVLPKFPRSDKPKKADRPHRTYKKTPKGNGERGRTRNILKSQRGPPYKVDGAKGRPRHSPRRSTHSLRVAFAEPVLAKGQKKPRRDFITVPRGCAALLVDCTTAIGKCICHFKGIRGRHLVLDDSQARVGHRKGGRNRKGTSSET